MDSVNGQHGPLALKHAILVCKNELVSAIHQYHDMVVTGVRVRHTEVNVVKSKIVQVTTPSSVSYDCVNYTEFTAA